jgi:glutathione S-transferase
LRRDLSMNIRRRVDGMKWPDDTRGDIARVLTLWSGLREEFGAVGPWLFGERSIADAFLAPVVTRFRSYGVALPAEAAVYSRTLLSDVDFRSWEAAAIAEPWTIPSTDILYT